MKKLIVSTKISVKITHAISDIFKHNDVIYEIKDTINLEMNMYLHNLVYNSFEVMKTEI